LVTQSRWATIFKDVFKFLLGFCSPAGPLGDNFSTLYVDFHRDFWPAGPIGDVILTICANFF